MRLCRFLFLLDLCNVMRIYVGFARLLFFLRLQGDVSCSLHEKLPFNGLEDLIKEAKRIELVGCVYERGDMI